MRAKAKEVHRHVLGVHAADTRGGAVGWLVYRVAYSDGTERVEMGRIIAPFEAAELGLYESLRHAAMANAVLINGLSARDEKIRKKRRKAR